MAELFTSLSADLPPGLWALLVVGTMLAGATVLFLWWEMFFKLASRVWRWAMPNRTEAKRHRDASR